MFTSGQGPWSRKAWSPVKGQGLLGMCWPAAPRQVRWAGVPFPVSPLLFTLLAGVQPWSPAGGGSQAPAQWRAGPLTCRRASGDPARPGVKPGRDVQLTPGWAKGACELSVGNTCCHHGPLNQWPTQGPPGWSQEPSLRPPPAPTLDSVCGSDRCSRAWCCCEAVT